MLYQNRFKRFGILTIAAVFFLIFVGGLVRSTGSGMGCPDWPKCFGNWIPPTDISELPADYKTQFAVAGKEIADFNIFKTWTEYLNRLVGVLIGIFIFITVLFAIPYLKSDKKVFWLSFLAFILVGLQGWIGAKVVATDLATWLITIHMLLALVIVGLLIYTITRSQDFVIEQLQPDSYLKQLIVLSLIVSLVQTISGTQVREAVDQVAMRIDNRFLWTDQLGSIFLWHRSWSILNLGVSFFLMIRYKKVFHQHSIIYKSGLALILLMSTQALTGAILVNFGFPGQFQSLHLTLGSLTAGLQIFIAILVFTKTKFLKNTNV
ncbi:MAG: COX15/CtaA family protein [Bacteroidia bacterium]|nr:COX15/CtaA family protein [Bacteroidia bacterium]